jgi:DNA-binding NarL/FixJ family response regulator
LEAPHPIGHGDETRDIAAALHRSVKTIETYRSRIKTKLGLKNPTALAQTARQLVHRVLGREDQT